MRPAAFLLALLPSIALAAEHHAHQVGGGWWECDAGYVSKSVTGGVVCVLESEANADKFVLSTVPSAGDGSRVARSCPSGGCVAPTQMVIDSGEYVTPSGWLYTPSNSPFQGGRLSRGSLGGVTVYQLPPPW